MNKFLALLFLAITSTNFAQNVYSVQFDGIDDYIDVNNSSIWDLRELSIVFWIKTSASTAGPGNFQGLITRNCNGCGEDYSMLIGQTTNGDVSLSGGSMGTVISNPLNDETWHFVVATRDTFGVMNIYVDANLVNTSTGPTDTINNTVNLVFGRFHPSNPSYYEGWLDDISIWEIALDSNQVQQYMLCPPVGDEDGVLGFWDFEQGSGLTAMDFSFLNPGSLINGVTWSTDVPVYNCFVDVEEDNRFNQIRFYPNPSLEKVTIDLKDGMAKTLIIKNSLGQVILSEMGISKNHFDIDISSYSKGIYLVQLEVNGEVITKKLIKK